MPAALRQGRRCSGGSWCDATVQFAVPQHVIDEALAEDREKAAAEWLAEWRSDLADFLDKELVDALRSIQG